MRVTEKKFTILPPAPDLCQTCAIKHEPDFPHDVTSLYYQMKFKLENDRFPSWDDAMAHCDDLMKGLWRAALDNEMAKQMQSK